MRLPRLGPLLLCVRACECASVRVCARTSVRVCVSLKERVRDEDGYVWMCGRR